MSELERLQELIASTFQIPKSRIQEDTTNEDLEEWDSIAQLKLMMAIEETFGLTLEVEDFERLDSVPSILAYLREHPSG